MSAPSTAAMSFRFEGLFVLDLANNHQGDVAHGTRIVRECAQAVRKHGVRAAIKFQFRELDSFIHPAHRKGSDNKHVGRFLSTRLDRAGFQALLDAVRAEGLLAMCTPFDEPSVDAIVDMKFDVLKIASCSAADWPLLEKAATAGLPILASTGGLAMSDIDNLVSFFTHRAVDFALMHCVSIYPTPDADMQLNQIDALRRRYPGVTIGWSTHEAPEETMAVAIAVAKGARMFERHVGVATDKITLNAYSSTPAQVDAWLAAHAKARAMCGAAARPPALAVEADSILSLRRGVFARGPVKAGTTLTRDMVYFAMPYAADQLDSGRWREGIVAETEFAADAPLALAGIRCPSDPAAMVLKRAIHDVKAMLAEALVPLDTGFQVEFSHHYGMERFREIGTTLITCVNREYCKKLLIQLPGQRHPLHYHKRKEETFQVLAGELISEVDGRVRRLGPGETALVLPGVWHRFWSEGGAVVEELSTTHYNDDSVYQDPAIQALTRAQRKTVVDHWGRYQIG
ncbi:MAG: N-acetylneuraminate synthase family protein [Azospirillum sp.]|nr:N-acetylneuraminate synthase family protein [Azospirillum sp.]